MCYGGMLNGYAVTLPIEGRRFVSRPLHNAHHIWASCSHTVVCGWQVKLCDPLVTHGLYLSALEVQHDKALYKSTFTLLYFIGISVSPSSIIVY